MKLLLILLFFISFKSFSFDNDLYVKGGLSLTQAKITALNGSNDKFHGIGFNTHFGYKWHYLDFGLSSYIYWGDIDNLEFQATDSTIIGDGKYRHVSFGPMLKYKFLNNEVFRYWHAYIGLGPTWSLQTIKLSNFSSTGSFTNQSKLTYQSRGATFVIGIEEELSSKEQHPVFIEGLFSVKKSQKVSVVDNQDPTETNILSTENTNQKIIDKIFTLSMGMTFF